LDQPAGPALGDRRRGLRRRWNAAPPATALAPSPQHPRALGVGGRGRGEQV